VARDRLRLEDLSDREFLLILADVTDADGWADSQQVAERLDLTERRVASSRLSWLQRWGAVEREHERDEHGSIRYRRNGKPFYTQRWRLTPIGEDMATGRLRKAQEKALAEARDADMLMLTKLLAEHQRHGNTTVANLMRREWRYQTEYHRNGNG
jgi:hypothetical protein